MLGPVMQQMAPLAERLDVAVPAAAVRGVVVEMRRRQHDLGRPARLLLGRGRAGDLAAAAITPGLARLVPPAAIAQMAHHLAVRPPTGLAAALGAHEPHPAADLRPVDRVVVAQLGLDRHGRAQL